MLTHCKNDELLYKAKWTIPLLGIGGVLILTVAVSPYRWINH